MNQREIEHAAQLLANDPVLGPAARYLKGYQELVDTVSDGWSYWRAGTRPADTLCELVGRAFRNDFMPAYGFTPATQADVDKAIRRIRAFMTRRSDVFKGERVPS